MINALAVENKMVKKTDDGLLTFDEDSPLFVKKKTTTKSKTTKKVEDKPVEEAAPKEKPKRRRRTTKKKEPVNPHAPKYVINGPEDCKHILPAFKKHLNARWKLLTTGSTREASEVANYLRGAAILAKEKRPKEYEELHVLIRVAKKLAEERNKINQNE